MFLDRDGTMIQEKEYLHRPTEVRIIPGVPTALHRLRSAGFLLIIVTNQSGIGRGYFTRDDVDQVHRHLLAQLYRSGVEIDRVYVAPEAPDQPSVGRKPSPQFLFDARDAFQLDLGECFMIGDKLCDLECGWNAGVKRSILVRTGYGRTTEGELGVEPGRAAVVADLPEAAEWILNP